MDAVTTDEGRKYHTPEGIDLPSITTVLSILSRDSIAKWRKRVGEVEANKISTRAANRGTAVHTVCEKYLDNDADYLDGVMPNNIETFQKIRPILDENVNNIHAQEAPLYSTYLGVAGRVDCVAEWQGKLSIIDFKTSRKERNDDWNESYYIQASAYAEMFEERTGIEINQIVILVVTEDGIVQEFVKTKGEYIPKLIEAIDDFTTDWEKENEMVHSSSDDVTHKS